MWNTYIGPPHLGGVGLLAVSTSAWEFAPLKRVCLLLSFLHWIRLWLFFILQGWEGNFFCLVLSASGEGEVGKVKLGHSSHRVQTKWECRRGIWIEGQGGKTGLGGFFFFFLLPGHSVPPEVLVPFFPASSVLLLFRSPQHLYFSEICPFLFLYLRWAITAVTATHQCLQCKIVLTVVTVTAHHLPCVLPGFPGLFRIF